MPGNRPHHTDKWRSCVQKVQEKGTGNAYAICTNQLGTSIESRDASGAPAIMTRPNGNTTRLDDADGDRGDVAEPATKMPRSNGHSGVPGGLTPPPSKTMSSRCAMCGQAMSARDAKYGGTKCCDCAMDEGFNTATGSGNPDRPGGSTTAPRKPMDIDRTHDGSGQAPLSKIQKRPALADPVKPALVKKLAPKAKAAKPPSSHLKIESKPGQTTVKIGGTAQAGAGKAVRHIVNAIAPHMSEKKRG